MTFESAWAAGPGVGDEGFVAFDLIAHLFTREALLGGLEGGVVEVEEGAGDEDFFDERAGLGVGAVDDAVGEILCFGVRSLKRQWPD